MNEEQYLKYLEDSFKKIDKQKKLLKVITIIWTLLVFFVASIDMFLYGITSGSVIGIINVMILVIIFWRIDK